MTDAPRASASDLRSVLAATRQLTRQVRREQRSGWFPLLVFAMITFTAIPFDRYSGHRVVGHCSVVGPGKVCVAYSPGPLWYWLVATVLTYIAISLYYLSRARRRGVGSHIQMFVVSGIVLLVLVTAWSVWTLADPAIVVRDLHVGSSPPADVLSRVASPAGAIGLALVVLAWVESSVAVASVAAVYLLAVLTAVGRHTVRSSALVPPRLDPWGFLPHVLILGGVLLVGSAAVAVTQRWAQVPGK